MCIADMMQIESFVKLPGKFDRFDGMISALQIQTKRES
jgi:hypothetical protein